MKAVMRRPIERAPYQAFGASRIAWRSHRPEILLCGPADTGKSRGIIEKLHHCAMKYRRARILMVRKTRKSLGQTAMVTYEQKVLPQGWLGDLIHFDTTDQQYEYPNGSLIAVGGMDNADKVLSSEWDMIYPQEATELSENDWEILGMRLRNGAMPYQQLLGDCNPGPPTHWLKQRCDLGLTYLLNSRHEDNPSITPERIARLKRLTGVRYLRYYLGQWAAAEGMVYEQWDGGLHKVSRKQLIAWGILTEDGKPGPAVKQVFASVDWGYTNPGVILVWFVDGDGRMYLIREIYMTQKVDDWWVARGKELKAEYGITSFHCDPSEPAYIAKFRANGLNAIEATNDIRPGITAIESRLQVAGDGRPRIFVYEFSLVDRDETLVDTHKPFCLEGEILEYVWPKAIDGKPIKEIPVDLNNHACLIAGTMITTSFGTIPVEQIVEGDYVLTRNGYRRVKAAGMTVQQAKVYTLHCSNGKTLTGTGNHPVYVRGKGYIDLRALRYGDIIQTTEETLREVSVWNKNQSALFTRASHLGAILTHQNGLIETTISQATAIASRVLEGCIRRYGKMYTDRFLKDMKSIIKTRIRSTTHLKTSNVSLSRTIKPITSQPTLRKSWQSAVSGLIEYVQPLLTGINQKRGGHGIGELLAWHGKRFIMLPVNANIAEQNFRRLLSEHLNGSALISVNLLPAVNQAPIMSSASVLIAEKSSPSISILMQGVAPISVLSVCEEEAERPVYNLTVETDAVGEEGEYFANGVLVHNCDAMRYAAMALEGPDASAYIAAIKERAERQKSREQEQQQRQETRKPYWQ